MNTNIAAEWSVAYAVSVKRLDSQFMLCLLRLMSWPNLANMHGDLVDDLRLICALLAKRPMVGFLIARRLKLSVDKTYALLSLLESKGHIHTVGANLIDVDLEVLDSVKSINTEASNPAYPPKVGINEATAEPENSGDVLNQLWRVLNTDIVMSKAARANMDPKAQTGKEAGDILSQLWQVLNTDISAKPESIYKSAIAKVTALGTSDKTLVKNSEKAFADINGQGVTAEKSIENEAKDVMSQLWSVLNTDIGLRKQSGADAGDRSSDAKTKEVSEVMSQLWRVLNTEIAAKRQSTSKAGAESLSDTTREANDKLSKLWRILDAEITIKKKPKTYVMTRSPAGMMNTEVTDISGEAVDRLSQLWQVLNSEITINMPSEGSPDAAKRY